MCEICSKSQRQLFSSVVFVVNFEQISHIALMFSFLVDFEKVNVAWVTFEHIAIVLFTLKTEKQLLKIFTVLINSKHLFIENFM